MWPYSTACSASSCPTPTLPYIQAHTVGIEDLRRVVERYTPRVRGAGDRRPPRLLHAAADLLIHSPTLLSTALQGVYQSHQATAAACQINNIHLLLGQLGRPGAGVLQMNGQPTAQNNRECGCNGEFPGFRNASNEAQMRELAGHWEVDVGAAGTLG